MSALDWLSREARVELEALITEHVERIAERRRWADVEGVADHLGCDVRRVRALRELGLPALRLPGERDGTLSKRLMFDLREVDAWVEREGVKA